MYNFKTCCYLWYALSVSIIIVQEMESAAQVQILEEAFCISLYAKASQL